MPVNATFTADFSSFLKAIDQAEVALVDFGKGASTVEKKLNSMVDNFSGRKVIQEAMLLEKALGGVEGVAKLTDKEIAKLGATSNEAAEKMRKLGIDVPPGIQAIADATKQADQATVSFEDAIGLATTALSAFGVSLSVEAVIGFVKGLADGAAALGDLSTASGISTDDLQKLGYVGAGVGATTEQMAKGVSEFSQALMSGKLDQQIAGIGLSVENLKAAGPAEAFLQWGEAVATVQDPMLRTTLESQALGDKLANTLSPSLKNLRTDMNNVPKDALISKDAIQSVNDLEGALGKAEIRLKGMVTQAIFEKLVKEGAPVVALWGLLTGATKAHAEAIDIVLPKAEKQIDNATYMKKILNDLRTQALEPLTDTQKAQIRELDAFNQLTDENIKLTGASVAAAKLLIEADKAQIEEMKRRNTEAEKYADIINNIVLKATGDTIKLEKQRAVEREADAAKMTAAVLAELAAETSLNAQYGLNAMGVQQMTGAYEAYTVAIEALNKEKEKGLPTADREALLNKTLTDDLLKEAEATDKATQAFWKARDAVKAKGDEIEQTTQKVGVYKQQLHDLVSDPSLAAFFGGTAQGAAANTLYSGGQAGITPQMAAAMAAGQFIQMAGVGAVGLQKRAAGGPVSAGQPYLVGEKGPELFVPGQSGTVAANGAGVTVNNVFHIVDTEANIARRVSDQITKAVLQGRQMAS